MIIDSTQRLYPHLKVLKGWTGNEPASLSQIAKPAAGENIISGMAISLNAQGEWVKASQSSSGPIYFAWEDQAEPDTEAAEVLLGLSSLGSYRLQTALFVSGSTFVAGDAVGLSAVAEQAGLLVPLVAASPRVGYIVKGNFSLGAKETPTTYTAPIDNSAPRANLEVVQLDTSFAEPVGV